jgi:hypothetical protein
MYYPASTKLHFCTRALVQNEVFLQVKPRYAFGESAGRSQVVMRDSSCHGACYGATHAADCVVVNSYFRSDTCRRAVREPRGPAVTQICVPWASLGAGVAVEAVGSGFRGVQAVKTREFQSGLLSLENTRYTPVPVAPGNQCWLTTKSSNCTSTIKTPGLQLNVEFWPCCVRGCSFTRTFVLQPEDFGLTALATRLLHCDIALPSPFRTLTAQF